MLMFHVIIDRTHHHRGASATAVLPSVQGFYLSKLYESYSPL